MGHRPWRRSAPSTPLRWYLVGGMHVGGSAESLAVVRCVMSLSHFRKGRERGEKKIILFEQEEK